MGDGAFALKDYVLASKCFARGVRLDPTNVLGIQKKADALLLLKQYQSAGETFEKYILATKDCGDSVKYYLSAAESYFKCKQYVSAIRVLHTCIETVMVGKHFGTSLEKEDYFGIGLDAINMIMDLYLLKREYQNGIQIVQQHFKPEIENKVFND